MRGKIIPYDDFAAAYDAFIKEENRSECLMHLCEIFDAPLGTISNKARILETARKLTPEKRYIRIIGDYSRKESVEFERCCRALGLEVRAKGDHPEADHEPDKPPKKPTQIDVPTPTHLPADMDKIHEDIASLRKGMEELKALVKTAADTASRAVGEETNIQKTINEAIRQMMQVSNANADMLFEEIKRGVGYLESISTVLKSIRKR